MPSKFLNAHTTLSYLHRSIYELAPFWSSGIPPFPMGSPTFSSVAALWTATEAEGTIAVLQQCESCAPTAGTKFKQDCYY